MSGHLQALLTAARRNGTLGKFHCAAQIPALGHRRRTNDRDEPGSTPDFDVPVLDDALAHRLRSEISSRERKCGRYNLARSSTIQLLDGGSRGPACSGRTMQRKRLQRAAGAAEVGAFIHIAIDGARRGSDEQHLIAARCAAGMVPIFKVGVRHFKPRPKALASIPGRRGITGGVVGRRSTDTHLAKYSSYTFVREIFQPHDDTTRNGCTLKPVEKL